MSKLLLAADRPVRDHEAALVKLMEELSRYKVTAMGAMQKGGRYGDGIPV